MNARNAMRARTMRPHGGAGIHAPWPWPRGEQKMCVRERERKRRYYIRGFYFTAISGLGRFGGGGVLRQRLRPPESCRPPGPRSCQLARCPRTLPPPLRRPLCPSWRAGFAPISAKSGCSRASGWILGSWDRRLELGANTYGVLGSVDISRYSAFPCHCE